MARILLAEDDDGLRETFRRVLERMGHDVVAAPSGDKAWAVLHDDQSFGLALSDTQMGDGMSGSQLLQQVRDDTKTRNTLFVLMSGMTNTEDITALRVLCDSLNAIFMRKQKLDLRRDIPLWLEE